MQNGAEGAWTGFIAERPVGQGNLDFTDLFRLLALSMTSLGVLFPEVAETK